MSQSPKVTPTEAISACPYFRNSKRDGSVLKKVEDHARFFATADDEITNKSQVDAYHALGIHNFSVDYLKESSSVFSNILLERKLNPNTCNLVKHRNPAASGIWDSDGKFNEERFNRLAL